MPDRRRPPRRPRGRRHDALGLANLVQHALMATDAIATPAGLGAAAVPWHLALWDPVWIAGGVLFLATARLAAHGSQDASTM